MKRNVKTVKNSLKFKAQQKEGILSVRIGVRKYNVPIEARILSDDEFIFLSFPASSELYHVSGKTLTPMDSDADATNAYAALNPVKKRTRRRRAKPVEVPDAVQAALKSIPKGYRLQVDIDGTPRLVRSRVRKKK